MKLENQVLVSLLSDVDVAVIVSSPENGTVYRMNKRAEDILGRLPEAATVKEIYDLTPADEEWYESCEISPYTFEFRTVILPRTGTEVVMDSLFCENTDGDIVRVDTLCPAGCQDYRLCHYKYELVSVNQTWKYPDSGSKDDMINLIMKAALFIYAADRCFIFEVDPDINCVMDVYSQSRTGFNDLIAQERVTDTDGIRNMLVAWENSKTIKQCSYSKQNQSEILRTQLYNTLDVWNYLIVPFPHRSGIRCFLGVDNYKRFDCCESVLRNLSILAAGEMLAQRLLGMTASARQLGSTLSHTPENQIYIRMFGGLTVSTNLGIQQDEGILSTLCGTFFIYLLSNRRRIVPVHELAEILWPDQLMDNPYNMIKNVAFRTKKMFEGICSLPIIVAGGGTYSINKELKIWVDTEEFEILCQKAANTELAVEKRIEICCDAVKLYKGSALPNFEAELWLSAKINYYRVLYNELIQMYVSLLKTKGDLNEILRIVSLASEIEELDNSIHILLLEALIEKKYYRYAKNHFDKIKKQLSLEEEKIFREMWQH